MNKRYEVYLTYNEDNEGGEICEGQEDDSYPDREDAYRSFSVEELFASNEDKRWVETIEIDFDPQEYIGKEVFLVIVRYSTGDTFGTTHGAWAIEGCYADRECAKNIVNAIRKDAYNGAKYSEDYKQYNRLMKAKYSYSYTPWAGYFEQLESVEVEPITLKEK